MQQRYYDPIAGRFLSVDPVVTDAKTGGSFNRYVYGNNNSYRFTDPDGRNPKLVADFLLNVGLNVVTTGEFGLASAAKETLLGALNPAKTLQTAAKLGEAVYKGSKLARNMANAGRGVEKGKEHAHHIVAQGAKDAKPAQDVLEKHGIGIHSAENGAAVKAGDHQGLHTKAYYQDVNQRITAADSAGGKPAVVETLKSIGKELER